MQHFIWPSSPELAIVLEYPAKFVILVAKYLKRRRALRFSSQLHHSAFLFCMCDAMLHVRFLCLFFSLRWPTHWPAGLPSRKGEGLVVQACQGADLENFFQQAAQACPMAGGDHTRSPGSNAN